MELALLAVLGLVLVVGVSMLSGRIGVAAPLLLVVLGIGIGYVPGVPPVSLDPEIILLGILPPLLYSAAVNVPILDLRRNVGPIAGLSVVLVIVSAVAIGALLHLVVPQIPLAAAIALGAVVAPTDAVAATSIGKRLGMPPRLVTILEGESLVNDATSLVLLRTAIAAVAGSFVFWEAVGQFAFAVAVAVVIGLLIGVLTVWLRSKLVNPVYDTIVSFTVPFISFVPTEAVGASGVLAVVITGLYSGHHAAKKFSATARINERLNWRTVQFILENGVFLVMGLQLHALVDEVGDSEVTIVHIGLISVGVVAILILCRMVFMIPLVKSLARALPRYEARATGMRRLVSRARNIDVPEEKSERYAAKLQRVERMARRTAADLEHAQTQSFGWRGAFILGWSGMRGVVTLAAAQSIPTTVPYRPQLVLIAFIVATITLLLHGLSLPWVIRRLRPAGPTADERSDELVSLGQDLVEEATTALDGIIERERALAEADPSHRVPSEAVAKRVRASAQNALAPLAFAVAAEHRSSEPDAEPSEMEREAYDYLRLARLVLDAQRDALLEERAIGQYSSQALHAAELALDAHESRLTPPQHH